MDALVSSLERSPELFPFAIDLNQDAITLIRLSAQDYEEASFLDRRALGPHTLKRTLPWRQLEAAVAAGQLEERWHGIFQIGHVGSTLLSRLLGVDSRLFALREPSLLRLFAAMRDDPEFPARAWNEAQTEKRLSVLFKLWSRTFSPEQTALIKATSFVSELAPRLIARPSAPKAILLFVGPEVFITGIIGGDQTRHEARTRTATRLERLHRRIGREVWRLASLSEGEALAMAWAVEMSALAEARAVAGPRALAMDFDRFLAAPQEQLLAALHHLGCEATAADAERILSSGIMERYSKGQHVAFNPAMRSEVLAAAREEHAEEIAKGLAWLDAATKEFPQLGACLEMAEAARV